MDELTKHLGRCDVLASLTVAQMERLSESCRLRKYARNSCVYMPQHESRHVLLLTSGRAKLSHITLAGKHSTLFFLQPGDLFGEMAVCDSGDRDDYCDTLTDSSVVTIPADDLRQLMRDNPDFSLAMTRLICQRRRHVERRLKSILFATTRQKLCHILLDLSRDFGERPARSDSNGVGTTTARITIPLSHHELGNLIGTTRESVTLMLGQLRSEGLIDIDRRCIVLMDASRLRESVSFNVEH
ncbi:helix-turn-helix domain-containing protein [bacterium]|nr:helix-turn-helix domain-containing protein [bacterium]